MTEANWPLIAKWVDLSEGGFVFNPHDPGGATNHGITRAVLAAWRGHPVTVNDVMNLSWTEANEILKAQYFDAVHGSDLPPGLDYAVTDAGVNSGPVRAIQWLQASLGIEADGHWGVITKGAVAALKGVPAEIDAYDRARLGFLRHLRTWPYFGRGWFARVNLVTERSKWLATSASA